MNVKFDSLSSVAELKIINYTTNILNLNYFVARDILKEKPFKGFHKNFIEITVNDIF